MPQPVALRLSRNSKPSWLTHLGRPRGSPLRPILLFPGGSGQGVEVEDSLLLATSPLLQRANASHGSCSSTAIFLPFITSTTALCKFVALLRQGSVTIAKEEKADLEAIFAVLEIKIETSIGAVCETTSFTKGDCELLETKNVKPMEGLRPNQKNNQHGCTTASVDHTLKTPSLLHTTLSSPAKRPAVTSAKDMSKRHRTCPGQVDSVTSAPTKPIQPHDPVTSTSLSSMQKLTNVPEPTKAETEQVLTLNEPKGKCTNPRQWQSRTMAIQDKVAPKPNGSEAGIVSSATRQSRQASAGQQQQNSCASKHQPVQGQLFETPQGKVLQQGNRRILLGPNVTVKDGKVEVSLEQMAALTGTRPLYPKRPQAETMALKKPPALTEGSSLETHSLPNDKGATPPSVGKESIGAQRKKKMTRLQEWETKSVAQSASPQKWKEPKVAEKPTVDQPSADDKRKKEFDKEVLTSSKMVMHKAKGHVEPYGLDRLVDEFEVEFEEEENQTLFNSSAAGGEEPHLDVDEDTTPSQADASDSMKCQIERELEEAVAIPSNHASTPPQPTLTPTKCVQTKSFLSSTPSQYNQATPTELQKIASLQHSQTPPDTATPARFFKPIVIIDSDGDWTVGGQESPKFKSKAGKERKLKKPMQLEQDNMFKSSLGRKDQGEPPISITPTQQSSPVCGSDKTQPTTSPLPLASDSQNASGFFTPVEYKTGMRSKQEPVHLNTPKDVKEAEAKKVRKDNLPPLKTDEILQRSPPKSEVTPVSPRSLKKFALGLRQSRSLGRKAFAKEDWSFFARQRKQENSQDCPKCGRTFSTGAGLSCHMRNKH